MALLDRYHTDISLAHPAGFGHQSITNFSGCTTQDATFLSSGSLLILNPNRFGILRPLQLNLSLFFLTPHLGLFIPLFSHFRCIPLGQLLLFFELQLNYTLLLESNLLLLSIHVSKHHLHALHYMKAFRHKYSFLLLKLDVHTLLV